MLPQRHDIRQPWIGISIPTAGQVVSAYALGVVVGAPVIAALGARTGRNACCSG